MTDWSFAPIFDSYATVAGITCVLALLSLVGPNFGRLTLGRRAALTGLRLTIVALLALAMLRPTATRTETRSDRAVVAVLLDQSRSMLLPDSVAARTRWDAQKLAITSADAAWTAAAERLDVQFYVYDESLHPLEGGAASGQLPVLPATPAASTAGHTDIGSSLHAALRRNLGRRLAGIVLMGDGVQTAAEPAVEQYEAARELARVGCPLYTIAFGPVGAEAQARDVAVESFPDQFSVFVKNELQIRGLVRVRGYVNQELPVELAIENEQGQTTVLGPQVVMAREHGQQVEVVFRHVPQETGRFKLTLRAASQPGELVTKNNQLTGFLSVLDGGLKVLFLEGEPRHEQRFLARSLDASPDIDLDVQWIDSRQRNLWPVDLSESLRYPAYDVVIIGDLDSSAFRPKDLDALIDAVQRGQGLIMLGGYHSFGPGGYVDTRLADVLPIKMDKFERQNFGEPSRSDTHWPGPLAMLPTRRHPVTTLGPDAENAARWQSLPPLEGANRFTQIKDAAGVQVLLESPPPQSAPLLISAEYGRGRVLAFAGDSTWRWVLRGRGADHKRFWRQVVLWLAQREESEKSDVWIRLAQRRYAQGSRPSFQAGVRAPTGDPVPTATLEAQLVTPDGKRSPLRLTREKDEWSAALDAVEQPGDYRVEIVARDAGRQLGTANGEFMVFDQDIELATVAADRDQLARLAQLTADSGGRMIPAEQLSDLLKELLAQSREFQVEIQTRWQLADRPLEAWLIFLALLGLFTADWYLRKRWALV